MSCRTTSGGSVSTSLARAFTGLEDKEIQHLFHALKREGEGMNPPSELDLHDWRERQHELIARAKRMGDSKKDALRSKLFRARSEPVPDGATFYAWSRIEARARQEVAVRSISDTAIDLDPPGSQRHLYELDDEGLPAKVWYASYGSNLHRDRFLTYIKGGQPPGSQRVYDGCRDQSIPDEDIPIRFAGARPHFALTSRVWRGGIAFIDAQKGETATGLGRAYAVSRSQFEDVVAQENGLKAGECSTIPYEEVLNAGRVVTGSGPYETLLHIGDYNGAPVLTFTAPFSTKDATTRKGHVNRAGVRMPVMTNKPSPAYIRMIGSGLQETFDMNETAQADYLRGCPGGDRYTRQQMVKILRGEDAATLAAEAAAAAKATQPASKTRTTPEFSATTGADLIDALKGNQCDTCGQYAGKNHTCPEIKVTKRAVETSRTTGSGSKAARKRNKKGRGKQSPPTATEQTELNLQPAARDVDRDAIVSLTGAARTGTTGALDHGAIQSSYRQRRDAQVRQASTRALHHAAVPGDNGQFFSGVKTYECGYKQESGIATWKTHVEKAKELVEGNASRIRWAQGQIDDPRTTKISRERVEHDLANLQRHVEPFAARLAEAQAKLRMAKAQRPATYYPPNPESWRFKDWYWENRFVGDKLIGARNRQAAAERNLAAITTGNGNGLPIEKTVRASLTRATREVAKYTSRLQETVTAIEALGGPAKNGYISTDGTPAPYQTP